MSDDFSGLGLSAKVTDAVAAAGYTKPTEIQAQAIPHVLEKKDIIGIAQTGTGKTASFVLPMLTLLENGRARARMPRTLILEPTRELAAQVAENFEKYGKNHRLNMALLIGGVSFDDQNKKLDRGADVLIATPGRMLDQFERGRILLTGVEILVIDEADRMLDMGFIPDIERICGLLPPRRQTLFFSATMPPEIERLTKRFLTRSGARSKSRARTRWSRPSTSGWSRVSGKPEEKRAALRQLDPRRGRPHQRDHLLQPQARRGDPRPLAASGTAFDAGGLHGDMDQKSRTETLDAFQDRQAEVPDRQRRRGARPRYSGGEPRLQFRRADPCRGLHPPHRPHRPRRPVGHLDHARDAARRQVSRRDHQADPAATSRRWVSTRARSPPTPARHVPSSGERERSPRSGRGRDRRPPRGDNGEAPIQRAPRAEPAEPRRERAEEPQPQAQRREPKPERQPKPAQAAQGRASAKARAAAASRSWRTMPARRSATMVRCRPSCSGAEQPLIRQFEYDTGATFTPR